MHTTQRIGISPIKKSKHHEEAHATQKDFLQKVKRLQAILAEMGNQFEEESFELYALEDSEVFLIVCLVFLQC
jgi:anti-sigma-K factor RskA